MADFVDYIRSGLGKAAQNMLVTSNPIGWTYGVLDLLSDGSLPGAIPSQDERRAYGTKKGTPDGDVKYWAGPDYGYQSGESYKKALGRYPSGFTPEPLASDTSSAPTPPQGGGGVSSTPGGGTPPAIPRLPGEPSRDAIPQSEDKGVKDLLNILQKQLTPESFAEFERIRNRSAIERSLVTSLLAQQQTKEKSRRDLETENIRAWRGIQEARINANATQAAALASAIWASSQISPSIIQESYKAALTPFQNFRLK